MPSLVIKERRGKVLDMRFTISNMSSRLAKVHGTYFPCIISVLKSRTANVSTGTRSFSFHGLQMKAL